MKARLDYQRLEIERSDGTREVISEYGDPWRRERLNFMLVLLYLHGPGEK
jgi:hypothetical protein